MNSEQLAAAVRYMDDVSDREGLQGVLQAVGVERSDLAYISEQRALRVVLMIRGAPIPKAMTPIQLSREEEMLLTSLATSCMDGICIGLAAAKGLSMPLPNQPGGERCN